MAPIRGRPTPIPRSWQRVPGALLTLLSVMVMLRCSKWLTLGFHPFKTALPIPHKIWQLWIHPTKQPSHNWRESSHSWVHLNPDWDYVFATLNHSSARAWVGEVFRHRSDVVDAFIRANETIQKADLLRYLWLLEEGGVYPDLDAQCAKPVRDWIPPRYRSTTGLVIGIEIDDYLEGHYDPNIPYIQLCQWTIMARPHHPTIAHVIDTVIGRLQNWEAGDVEELTGPKVFTEAVFESLAMLTGRQNEILRNQVSGLTEPYQIGDVLILPINAFGSGQLHSGSQKPEECDPFVVHSFEGSWRLGQVI